jgi:hypothetical protein
MASSGKLCLADLIKFDVSEEFSASIIRVTRMDELRSLRRLLPTVIVVPSSPTVVALMMEALSSSETSIFTEPHGGSSQKTPILRSCNCPLNTMFQNVDLFPSSCEEKLIQVSKRCLMCLIRTSDNEENPQAHWCTLS